MLAEKLGDTKGERLFHVGARNFVSTDIDGQRAEMIAIAQAASRSPNPIDHWLLSWREGELPTPAEIDETVTMFVEHLGVGGQPCIYACRGDTDNRHVHLALNRYDPLSRQMIEINDGFTREAAHQAVALIVDRFGWQAEADARYAVLDGRPVMAAGAAARQEEGRKPIGAKAAAFENRTGYRSAQRIVQEDAVPRIKAARSWRDLHAALAEIGIRYDLVGTNGVTLTVGDERVKASSIDRAITRTQVEKRFGAFEPRAAAINDVPRDPNGDRLAEAFRADEYRADCERWRRHQQARREQREALVGKSQDETEQSRPAVRERRAKLMPPPPDLESWYYTRREVTFVSRWRNRLRVTELPHFSGAASRTTHLPGEIDGYHGYPCSDGVRYARGPEEPTAFLDRGTKIGVVIQDDQAMLAALRLAALKFDGKLSVTGDKQFHERTFQLAQRNGLGHVLTDSDLAARWQAMQPKPPSQVLPTSLVITEPDARTSEREPAKGKTADKPIVATKSQTKRVVTAPPADLAHRSAAANGSVRAIDAEPVPPPKSVDDPPDVRAAVRAREAEVLKRLWVQAFSKLEDMERLPVLDDAGQWTIDTAGLSQPEQRALADPDREAETQKRLADMDAARADRERKAAQHGEATGVVAQKPPRIASSNEVAGPQTGRTQGRIPPIRSKGPDDVTAPPPGGGRAGPGR
ncbi:relaxase/mobilization nuclease domain-containing protein [Sphingomonas sp. CFBP 8764]|uniref:relaxase/mobilization nuclease domain-containing protein n=1 Tax=Sphingomonas sp. CFBP 8764 TaxID=2775275 RepID=UPI00177D0870|nr:relaxase/mobilization nuclease domain-containing protein [Sphingomonas sp. CFBP 8764]MBD8550286.1 relaxase/mobilization nuclease domain-containing protein [Sphingomonas sp. CFBP 8764]